MQRKTIAKMLKAKMDEWLASLPKVLADDVRKHLLVSGGSIASMFLGEDINDYDVYIQNRETLLRLVKHYINFYNKDLILLDGSEKQSLIESIDDFGAAQMSQYARAIRNLKDNQIRIFVKNMAGGFKVEDSCHTYDEKKTKYLPAFISPNAISLYNNVQIVNRFFGTPAEIHATFDFIHATNYFTMTDGLITNIAAVESLLTKQLAYQGSFYPVTSIIRVKKFLNRKWNINAGEQLKMMFQVSQLDLTNVDVLEEQLIGVDVAYFGALINALSNVKKEDMTQSYLFELIDKIFSE